MWLSWWSWGCLQMFLISAERHWGSGLWINNSLLRRIFPKIFEKMRIILVNFVLAGGGRRKKVEWEGEEKDKVGEQCGIWGESGLLLALWASPHSWGFCEMSLPNNHAAVISTCWQTGSLCFHPNLQPQRKWFFNLLGKPGELGTSLSVWQTDCSGPIPNLWRGIWDSQVTSTSVHQGSHVYCFNEDI